MLKLRYQTDFQSLVTFLAAFLSTDLSYYRNKDWRSSFRKWPFCVLRMPISQRKNAYFALLKDAFEKGERKRREKEGGVVKMLTHS